jgi:hypothetical protein
MVNGDCLTIRVNDELMLDAGTCETIAGPLGPEWLIHPPATTLFRQVLTHLERKPDPPRPLSGSMIGREGVAATALTLRWGSYLAVLLDRDKPLWSEVNSALMSRISDEEMARINIEASAALAEWVDLFRAGRGGSDYRQLVDRAVFYLPMPKKTATMELGPFSMLALPETAAKLIHETRAEKIERIRFASERSASRIFSNALINSAWRNGPVEDIHAGEFQGYPLDRRRVTPGEERDLLSSASRRLAHGMSVCLMLELEQPRRAWSEQVLPYGLAERMRITPSRWTLTESSRAVRLPVS